MKKIFILFLVALSFTITSCENLYEEMAAHDSDEAILYSARRYLAQGLWTEAISEFARLSTSSLAEPEVIVDRASAYSGRCGLDFLALADSIDNIGTTPFMEFLMTNFVVTSSTNWADCKLAEDLLKTAADSEGIVSTERGQFLMAFNSLAKIGSILNFRADANDNDVVDAGWDPCDGNGTTDLPNAEVSEITTGIVLFYKNLQGFSFGASLTQSIADMCTAVDGSGADFCDEIDTSGVDGNHRQLIRGVIRETDDGIGLQINPGDTLTNAAACPNS